MKQGARIKVVGQEWISNGGKNACPKCADLHGLKFYYHPKAGQLSIEQMPTPPLHPNCRCSFVAITKIVVPPQETNQGQSGQQEASEDASIRQAIKPYMKDVVIDPLVGLIWRKEKITKGPIYGKWGGLEWSGGKDNTGLTGSGPVNMAPEDLMDEAYMRHDYCYDGRDEIECDRDLIEDLENLPNNPQDWSTVRMSPAEIEYAKNYKWWALWWFRRRVERHEMRESAKEQIIISP